MGSLALIQFLSLEAALPLDAAVYQWLQAGRSCQLDHIGLLLKKFLIMYLVLLGAVAVCVLGLQKRWMDIVHASLTVLSGAFFCELL